jgi:hypothetical protein
VHAIGELAAIARTRLNQVQPGQPGVAPQQGWAAEPQAGPVPGRGGRSGPGLGNWPGRNRTFDDSPGSGNIADDIAGVVAGEAMKFIGRAVARRVQRTVTERVMPTIAANQETVLREQIAVAEKYPGLRACLTDNVVFLAGGSRVLPMPNLAALSMQQADSIVTQLRES